MALFFHPKKKKKKSTFYLLINGKIIYDPAFKTQPQKNVFVKDGNVMGTSFETLVMNDI